MALDERDYMIERIRERDREEERLANRIGKRYVERSPMRVNLHDARERRRRLDALSGWMQWVCGLLLIIALAVLLKQFLR